LEYNFPMGWRELQGFADRGNYDLSQHQKYSKKNLEINDEKYGKVLADVVCEPSLGVGRAFLVFMLDAYEFNEKRENIVLHLSPKLAPVKASIFPIVKDQKMIEVAKDIYATLREEWNVSYDDSGSVGRRYSRNDEIGTPLCITIDEETLKDKTVTIRDRDSTEQVRIRIDEIENVMREVIKGKSLLKFGKKVDTRKK